MNNKELQQNYIVKDGKYVGARINIKEIEMLYEDKQLVKMNKRLNELINKYQQRLNFLYKKNGIKGV